MAWVCRICSTNNPDGETKCMVCDYERVRTLTERRVVSLGLKGNVVVPAEFNVIGEGAFKGRIDVFSVTLHERVREISKEAFYGCVNLRSVVCPVEIETVGPKAFGNCTALPSSERVRARNVSSNAYVVDLEPPHPYEGSAPCTAASGVDSVGRCDAASTDIGGKSKKSSRYYGIDKYETKPDPWVKWLKLAIVVVLAFCLIPAMTAAVSALGVEGDVEYLVGIGALLSSTFVLYLYELIVCKNTVFMLNIMWLVALLLASYMAILLYPEISKTANVIMNSVVLLGDAVFLVIGLVKEYRGHRLLLCCTAVLAVMLLVATVMI